MTPKGRIVGYTPEGYALLEGDEADRAARAALGYEQPEIADPRDFPDYRPPDFARSPPPPPPPPPPPAQARVPEPPGSRGTRFIPGGPSGRAPGPIQSRVPAPEVPMQRPGEPPPGGRVEVRRGEPGRALGINFGDIFGGLTGAGPCPWAKVAYQTALQAAQAFGQQKAAFGTIQNPSANGGAVTAYQEDGQWRINMCRLGSDQAAGDQVVVGQVAPLPAEGGVVPAGGGVPMGPMGDGCAMPGPVAPRVVAMRVCPAGMRLAKDGQCYPKDRLPKAWYMNDPKPARISHSEWENLKKAKRTLTKVQKTQETADEITGRKQIETARKSAAKARAEVKMLTSGE